MKRGSRESRPWGQACLLLPNFDEIRHVAQGEGAVLGEIGSGGCRDGAKHGSFHLGVVFDDIVDFLVAVDNPGALGAFQIGFPGRVEAGHELLVVFVEFLVPAFKGVCIGGNHSVGGAVFVDVFVELDVDGMFVLTKGGANEEENESEIFHASLYEDLGGKVHPVCHFGLTDGVTEDF